MKRALLALPFAALLTFASVPAFADPPKGTDPATAQALFYEARNLMKDNKFAQACPKLEESLRLDYGIGTEFNLADCHEKSGKVASAWSGFISVAGAAKSQNQPQREKVARERAKALEPRLPKVFIDVVAPAIPGIEVKRDGIAIGSASWGTALPVDPGPHRITASAPGRQSWEGTVTAVEGKPVRVTVPVLASAPQEPVAVAPVPARTPITPAPVEPTSFPEPIVSERGAGQRTAGWVIGAIGLAGLGVGAGFGINSLRKGEESGSHCEGNLCNEEGVRLRDQAMTSGDIATIATLAGGAAVLGGLTLVLTAPRGPHGRETARSASSSPLRELRAAPQVGATGGGLVLQGVLF